MERSGNWSSIDLHPEAEKLLDLVDEIKQALCAQSRGRYLEIEKEQEQVDTNSTCTPQKPLKPCEIWCCVKAKLTGGACTLPGGLNCSDFKCDVNIDCICEQLKQLERYIDNCELKEQVRRAIRLCRCLKNTIISINCDEKCRGLVGRLFCLIIQVLLLFIAILEKINVLACKCDECNCNSHRDLLSTFCDCLICDLAKEICQAEELVDELNKLAIAFIRCNIKYCKPNCCKVPKHCKCNDYWDYDKKPIHWDDPEYCDYDKKTTPWDDYGYCDDDKKPSYWDNPGYWGHDKKSNAWNDHGYDDCDKKSKPCKCHDDWKKSCDDKPVHGDRQYYGNLNEYNDTQDYNDFDKYDNKPNYEDFKRCDEPNEYDNDSDI